MPSSFLVHFIPKNSYTSFGLSISIPISFILCLTPSIFAKNSFVSLFIKPKETVSEASGARFLYVLKLVFIREGGMKLLELLKLELEAICGRIILVNIFVISFLIFKTLYDTIKHSKNTFLLFSYKIFSFVKENSAKYLQITCAGTKKPGLLNSGFRQLRFYKKYFY